MHAKLKPYIYNLSLVYQCSNQNYFLLIININQSINQYIYIYIYKSRDLMRESMRSCHVTHFKKKIEIPLSHIRDKKKFKSGDFLFPLV